MGVFGKIMSSSQVCSPQTNQHSPFVGKYLKVYLWRSRRPLRGRTRVGFNLASILVQVRSNSVSFESTSKVDCSNYVTWTLTLENLIIPIGVSGNNMLSSQVYIPQTSQHHNSSGDILKYSSDKVESPSEDVSMLVVILGFQFGSSLGFKVVDVKIHFERRC